ncbi:MAG: hypothetical protein BI182_10075 [Acetobacterium sp. MES1]|uniref:DUF3169 family protein n=1 Tax=Acetobacterium sp. MES1 TaxID=1899015 RepID=UPI000B9C9D7F|nr:DUF3169 family protein [Acetobacterium sp. MES1]OXS25513.1 MAG: hypothetical protein BI182_10075 [Acetobacterium sp. MES1]
MKIQKQTLKFLIAIIVSSLIGGLLGWFIIHFETAIFHGLLNFQNLILHNNLYIQFFIFGLCALLILIIFFSVKHKLNRLDPNDDALFDQIDHQLGVLLPLISATMISGFCLFGITVTNALNEPVLIGLILFLLNTSFALIMMVLTIKLTKVLYPEKKGNPLDFNFDKEWIKSCDEAEKFVIYKASYRCYQLMNFVYCGVMTLCLLISIAVNIGIFPYLLIGFLWITQTLVYARSANRFQHGQLDNVQ